ncbi:Protoporphyrinogen IX oxidase, aerobic [Paraburkholderia caribensis]|nr:Protoporphyrinogen IX oxidase, aerobic [Paraburkholderia caribensis]
MNAGPRGARCDRWLEVETLSQMLVLNALAVCHEEPHLVGARVRANLKQVLKYGDDEPLPNASRDALLGAANPFSAR